MEKVIVTGAYGFLGDILVKTLKNKFPQSQIVPLGSSKPGGIDLSSLDFLSPKSFQGLDELFINFDPEQTGLVHVAACLEFNSHETIAKNIQMSLNLSEWSKAKNFAFNIFISTVSVYTPSEYTTIKDELKPVNYYGISKLAAENIWKLNIPQSQLAIVRPAGIMGLQDRPTLFWNKLLNLLVDENSQVEVTRLKSFRNYITPIELSNFIVKILQEKISGIFLAAGKEEKSTQDLIEQLEKRKGKKLNLKIFDDKGRDRQIFESSQEVLSELVGFEEQLKTILQDERIKV